MFGGFVKGTTPEGDYKFDAANWDLDYARLPQAVGAGKETTASLRHSGADFPKPVYLACDERGEYRIRSYANVYTSCRLPGKEVARCEPRRQPGPGVGDAPLLRRHLHLHRREPG